MKFTDDLWLKKWHIEPRDRVVKGSASLRACGSHREPVSSLWCASLAEAMGGRFREGMILTDWGCGSGRFFNFMTGWLERFTYYGIEIDTPHGREMLLKAQSQFFSDSRSFFNFTDSSMAASALMQSDVLLLGSVFTHLEVEELDRIFPRFIPLIYRGGLVILTVILKERYRMAKRVAYGAGARRWAWYTREQVEAFAKRRMLHLKEVGKFLEVKKHPVTIYRVTR